MEFQYVKSLHIIFVVTWFAGLFYLPRLMVYSAEASVLSDEQTKDTLLKQYQIMKKRLLYGITWPSAVITFLMGMRLLMLYPFSGWLALKLLFVFFLYLYMISLQVIFQQQQKDCSDIRASNFVYGMKCPPLFCLLSFFLVVLKNTVSLWWGMAGLFVLVMLLVTTTRLYKKFRKNNGGKPD